MRKFLRTIENKFKKFSIIKGLPLFAATMIFTGCKDNQKYLDFTSSIIKENKQTCQENGFVVFFDKEDKQYFGYYYLKSMGADRDKVSIVILDKDFEESFSDNNLNGLDDYKLKFKGAMLEEDCFFQSKENKKEFDYLLVNFPKWCSKYK